jgi:hypothetical protein
MLTGFTDGGDMDFTFDSGPVEPIIVTAIDVNKLAREATSAVNGDRLWYEIQNSNAYSWAAVDSAVEDYPDTPNAMPGKGVIYRRIDQFNNDCSYDHKAVRFVRFNVDYASIPIFDTSNGYNLGTIVRNAGTSNGVVYICTRPFTAGTPNANPANSGSTFWIAAIYGCISATPVLLPETGVDTNGIFSFNISLPVLGEDSYMDAGIPLDYNSKTLVYTFQQGAAEVSSIGRARGNYIGPRLATWNPFHCILPEVNFYGGSSLVVTNNKITGDSSKATFGYSQTC